MRFHQGRSTCLKGICPALLARIPRLCIPTEKPEDRIGGYKLLQPIIEKRFRAWVSSIPASVIRMASMVPFTLDYRPFICWSQM